MDTLLANSDGANFNGGKLYIKNSTGYVGINDTTPSYELDVNGTIQATTLLTGKITCNSSGTSKSVKEITISTSNPGTGVSGDIWMKY